jgi:hypothetical protein
MLRSISAVLAFAALFAASGAAARDRDEIPPANGKPLSEIIHSLETQGHRVITDVDFDENVWIVRVYKRGLEFEMRVDPVTGQTLSLRPTS